MDSLCRAFNGADTVYHLAASISIQAGDQEKLESINIEGTRNVLDACCQQRVSTLVYFSTIHALDQYPLDRAVSEDNPLVNQPQSRGNAYDYSKAQADMLVRENSCETLDTRIIYPTAVIGPRNKNALQLAG